MAAQDAQLSFIQTWNLRMQELRRESHLNTRGQHVVSRVILKQFADRGGMVRSIDVFKPSARSFKMGVGAAGKQRDFIPLASTSAEGLWHTVETAFPRALKLAQADELHKDSAAVDVIKATIALHFIRSYGTPITVRRAYVEARTDLKRRLFRHPMVEKEFFRRFGLHPAGPEAYDVILEGELAKYDQDFLSGLALREAMERQFFRAKEWLATSHLEVVHPAEGEFLIGDVPALTVANDRFGHVSGVALGDAAQIVMPISRRTLIAVGPEAAVGIVPSDVVDVLNSWQVKAAHKRVFFHPDSNLDAFVRSC